MNRHRTRWNKIVASCLIVCAAMTTQASAKDIVSTAVEAGSFKTLAAALKAGELVGALQGDGPFTVFAPTDEAFASLPAGTVEALLKPENKQQLISILTYHVVSGKVPAAQVVKLSGAKTLNGQQVAIKVTDGKVSVDEATVVKTDIECDNGVIHVIDKVLMPATDNIPVTATKAGNFETLVAAVKAAGLAEALSGEGPFTVFAPTDEAFAKLPAGTVETLLKPENKAKLASILKFHVVPGRVYATDAISAGTAKTLQGDAVNITVNGGEAKVNGAKIVATDIDASNGVIHVIDAVILPPENEHSVLQARKMIETAISEGAPLYNAGHVDACAKIYMKTAKSLLAMEEPCMCPNTTHTLQAALRTSEESHNADTRAWTMRRALDVAYNQMN